MHLKTHVGIQLHYACAQKMILFMKELSPLSQQYSTLLADSKDSSSQDEALIAAGLLLHSADWNSSCWSGKANIEGNTKV